MADEENTVLNAVKQVVAVKPLEWVDVRAPYGAETYESKTPVGFYEVFMEEDSVSGAIFAEWAFLKTHFGTVYAMNLGKFSSFELAKAAAQSDYEARILATLTPKFGVWQPIETAPRDGTVIDIHGSRKGSLLGMNIRIENCKWDFVAEKSGLLVKKDWVDMKGNIVVPTHWMPLPPAPDAN